MKFVEVKLKESSMLFNIKKIIYVSVSTGGYAIIQTSTGYYVTAEDYDVVVKRILDLIF